LPKALLVALPIHPDELPKPKYWYEQYMGPDGDEKAQAQVDSAIAEFQATPSGVGQRHDAYNRLCMRLVAMHKGNYPGLENVEALLEQIGRTADRDEQEMKDSIKGAFEKAEPRPLGKPKRQGKQRPRNIPQNSVKDKQPPSAPDRYRRTLFHVDKSGNLAMVFDLVYTVVRAGAIDRAHITASDVLRNQPEGWHCTKSTVYDALDTLSEFGFFQKLTANTHEIVIKSRKNPPNSGRPTGVYALPPASELDGLIKWFTVPEMYQRRYPAKPNPDRPPIVAPLKPAALEAIGIPSEQATELAPALEAKSAPAYAAQPDLQRLARKGLKRDYDRLLSDLENPTSAPLPRGWTIHNARDYRVAVWRAWKLAYPDADWLKGNARTARALGITVNTLRRYAERAGIEIESDLTETLPITAPVAVEKQVNIDAGKLCGRPLHYRVETTDGRAVQFDCSREHTARVVDMVAHGAHAVIEYQVPNRHTVRLDAQPPPPIEPTHPDVPAPRETIENVNERTQPHECTRRKRALRPRGYDPDWVCDQLRLRYLILNGGRYRRRAIRANCWTFC
jgi:hypothetical protein